MRASLSPLEAMGRERTSSCLSPCYILSVSQDSEPAGRSTYSADCNVAGGDDGPTLDVSEAFKMAPSANRYLRSVLPRSIYVEVHPHVGG